MKLAYVEWEDAAELDDTPWVFHDEPFVYEPIIAHQVGFVVYDGPEGMVLTSSYIGDGTIGSRSQIPRGMIRNVTIIDDND